MRNPIGACLAAVLVLLFSPAVGWAQAIETAGSRPRGMGGAFVALANDGSATWWNPAGMAAGPFLDLSIYKNAVQAGGDVAPAWRTGLTGFAVITPPIGASFYRFRL